MDWNKLTDEQFAVAAKAHPWAALEFASARLTDEQFAVAAKAHPWAALEFASARYAALSA
jgi:hypothetical protein